MTSHYPNYPTIETRSFPLFWGTPKFSWWVNRDTSPNLCLMILFLSHWPQGNSMDGYKNLCHSQGTISCSPAHTFLWHHSHPRKKTDRLSLEVISSVLQYSLTHVPHPIPTIPLYDGNIDDWYRDHKVEIRTWKDTVPKTLYRDIRKWWFIHWYLYLCLCVCVCVKCYICTSPIFARHCALP